MLDRLQPFTGEQDEADLLRHLCALVARDRHYAVASVAVVGPGGTLQTICQSGDERDVSRDAVSIEIHFAVAGEPLLFRAASNYTDAFNDHEKRVILELCELWGTMLEGMRAREARLQSERDRANHAEERLSALWKLANRTLSSDYDSKLLARDVLLEGRERLGIEFGYIARVDGSQMCVEIISSQTHPASSLFAHPFENTRVAAGETLCAQVVATNATIAANSVEHRATLRGARGDELSVTVRAFIATPFTANCETYVLAFVSPEARSEPFTEGDRRYVELLASIFCRMLEHRATIEQIEYLQDHDALTRLANRNRFGSRLTEILGHLQNGEPLAVLIIDTDKFRQLIEEYGPDAGDEIVLELAQRIRLAKGDHHELFRYRSDSFAIIARGVSAVAELPFFAERCISAIGLPMKLNGEEARLTASIGIALYPSDGADATALSIAATTAMRRAKRMGPAQFSFYNELLDERFGRRRLFAEDLREAVHKNELFLYYQPIVDLQTRRVIGAEALLRWHHPRRGIVGAAEFIHVAEETDLINEIGSWVLARASRQARQWHDEGRDLVVAVNLSARQFRDAGLLADVETAIRSSGVPPRLLEFEVTESVAMHDPGRAAYTLACFRDLGLRVALDDFGTGHSSLAYLKNFPVDIIKLDQSFVAGLPAETTSAAIAKAIVTLAKSLQCEVRAEGVELPVQEEWLREAKVHSAQGFLIAPALLPRALERWLAKSLECEAL